MFVKSLVAFLMCMFFMTSAMANDKPLEFKIISITPLSSDNVIKIVVKDQKNGVFVFAVAGWSGKFPKTSKLIRDMMIAKGIKVTEDPSTADVGLQFSNTYGFSLDDVENQSSSLDGGKLAAGVGAVIGGGIFGLTSLLSSNTDKPITAIFTVISANKPTITSRNKIDGENKFGISDKELYQANKDGPEVSTAAFVSYIDNFINNHFVFDTPPTQPSTTDPAVPKAVSGFSSTTPSSGTPTATASNAPRHLREAFK